MNYYRNHIGVRIKVNGQLIYQDDILDIPNLKPEMFASMCALVDGYACPCHRPGGHR